MLHHLMLLLLASPALAVTRRLVSTVVRLGDVAYYMHSSPLTGLSSVGSGQAAEPCTVLTVHRSLHVPTLSDIDQLLRSFLAVDDVWTREFAHSLIVQATFPSSNATLTNALKKTLLNISGVTSVYVVHVPEDSTTLPQGPYFLNNGHLHHAYRLYPDTAGAFIVATVPADDDNTFRSLDVSAYGEEYPSTLTVAVPSRLYFNKTEDKPYAGLRLGVKDIIDLKGLKTGASSLAYTALYPPRKSTAEAVQHLVDLGFVIVGKLKSTQFADSEWPTCDWVDVHAPFNPKGDGYLTTSGSSAGSAAAIASYDWLDFSLGTDTLGSIRSPAAAQGIFGMRSSLGAASFEGIVPYSPRFDTVGGFARTAGEFKVLAEALYGRPGAETRQLKRPTAILYPTDYWPAHHGPSQEVFDTFISRLEDFLGVQRTEMSLEEIWQQHRPSDIEESLSEYFSHVFEWGANPDQWTGIFKDFLPEYEAKFGKLPALNPQIRFKVDYLPTVTPEQQTEAFRRLDMYQNWFYQHVMPPSGEDGSLSTVMVLPWTNGEPDYRDTYRDGPQQFTGTGFFFYNVGPYAEAAELIIPAGNTPYVSKFTGKTEQLPAAVGILGARGSDVALARLVSDMFEEKAPRTGMEGEGQKTIKLDL